MRLSAGLPRRAILASALAAIVSHQPLPLLAAPSPDCNIAMLQSSRQTIVEAEALLPNRADWPAATARLDAIDEKALERALDACVDPKTLKDQAMNNAAFIVYYEERRYNDVRLEPEKPSLRAEQNGRKKELLRALADEKAELAFLLKKPDEDAADLREYAVTARKAIDAFIGLVPQPP